ncbi:MAG TPA: D-alanyl-D-alanine carboxypeptidase/D-alanyl-D-alanine-endopeptidase [Anaeromyxobacteraceae bacterium]|nr:D-alanyl-D-alanine carboxypeptidase/D-alanyl-D-alanine-endopeptidase [Anaeromyxobacteraceae bacterium]
MTAAARSFVVVALLTAAVPRADTLASAPEAASRASATASQASSPARPAGQADWTADLRSALDAIVAKSALRGARSSIHVASIDTGETIYAHDADALLNPASNVKLFTAAAALARLGPEFRFETELWLDARPDGKPRTLFVRGKGDPTLVTERLFVIAGELRRRGVDRVRDIVLDDSWFDGELHGPGYDQEEGDRSYLAPAGALSLNFNAIAIRIAPGARARERAVVSVEPESDHVQVLNRATTTRPGTHRRLKVTSALVNGKQRITVEGRLPVRGREQTLYRRIDDPAAYFGSTLRELLEMRGVKVLGAIRKGPVPADAHLLHVAESEALGDVVRRLNKSSNNFMAEQLVKTLGAQVKGPPGTWPKGIAAVEEFLAEAGIGRGSFVMKNGSGLNDANRFSARQTVTLLREMWRRFPLMAEFLSSLPVAGRDGTIRWRMDGSDAQGMLRAKTGTLESVTSLSGYVETASRQRLAFAILVNDVPRRRGAIRAVDALGTALAGAGRRAKLDEAVAMAVPPSGGPESAPAEAKGHIATYYQLGSAGDPRNIQFLRTALRTEQDPALRIAAAEAIYMSDPDADSARRAFLEAVAADASALGRLRATTAELQLPDPILSSLADLAVDGNTEAISRMIELAPVFTGDAAASSTYEDRVVDVAASAPAELLAALRTGDAAAVDLAVTALARGRSRATEPDGSFDQALAAAARDTRPEVASHARALISRLAERAAAAKAATITPPRDTVGPAM